MENTDQQISFNTGCLSSTRSQNDIHSIRPRSPCSEFHSVAENFDNSTSVTPSTKTTECVDAENIVITQSFSSSCDIQRHLSEYTGTVNYNDVNSSIRSFVSHSEYALSESSPDPNIESLGSSDEQCSSDNRDDDAEDETEETEEERRMREEEESEALARQLMAEEAVASYHQSADFLRDNARDYSEEDLAALQAIMAEEAPVEDEQYTDEENGDVLANSSDLSYEHLLRLGEEIGDVKTEMWVLRAKEEIDKLPVVVLNEEAISKNCDSNDCSVKCLVCQFPYEVGERTRVLPCGHFFHCDCVDQWLQNKDFCPYCRQSIVETDKDNAN